jgi:glycosyltransferase involved in cell wall biosynthesis
LTKLSEFTANVSLQMRIAWFSPLPPVRSGIAAYSAELLPQLGSGFEVDRYPEAEAHDFVWRSKRERYDLVVYQIGNAPCHDYMWAYLTAYPGLVVLHDARLHHARARFLLSRNRVDDYRHEFRFDHPNAPAGVEEYAVAGLGGPIYYLWSMLGVVMRTARTVAVHNEWVAVQLRSEFRNAAIEVIPMGVPAFGESQPAGVRARLGLPTHAIVFAMFGKVTAEKRVTPILRAFGQLVADVVASDRQAARELCLLIVGDATGYPSLDDELASSGVSGYVRVTGHIPESQVADYLAAADVCLCLRWPTALETSASWLRCLAAGRPTVISNLAHLGDTPVLDPRDWQASSSAHPPVAVAIDLMDEDRALVLAMRRLADDERLRNDLAREGKRYWQSRHTMEAMARAYERVMQVAASRPAPQASDLPGHVVEDYSGHALAVLDQFGVDVPF